jgi:hypothetical protein
VLARGVRFSLTLPQIIVKRAQVDSVQFPA